MADENISRFIHFHTKNNYKSSKARCLSWTYIPLQDSKCSAKVSNVTLVNAQYCFANYHRVEAEVAYLPVKGKSSFQGSFYLSQRTWNAAKVLASDAQFIPAVRLCSAIVVHITIFVPDLFYFRFRAIGNISNLAIIYLTFIFIIVFVFTGNLRLHFTTNSSFGIFSKAFISFVLHSISL